MSLYQVDKLLFALFNDLELQEKYKQNPARFSNAMTCRSSRSKRCARSMPGSFIGWERIAFFSGNSPG